MQKSSRWSRLLNLTPEIIALSIVLNLNNTAGLFYFCLLLLFYTVILRFIGNSAIIVHGLGHTLAIAKQGFNKSLVLDSNNDDIYYMNSAVVEQKETVEQLR